MQFQVPQNIDLEDKIIGPLTLKQFIILLVGGMFDYMWYTFFDTAAFILLAIPTTLFTLALVFARVREEPFPKFLGNLILFALKPKILTWGETKKPKIIETKKAKKEKVVPKVTSGSEIEKLARVIDTSGWSGSEIKAPAKPKIPATTPLAPVPQPQKRPRSLVEQITKKTRVVKAKPAKARMIQPKISQPQPIKNPTAKLVGQKVAPPPKPTQPIITQKDIKRIAEEVAKEEKTSSAKAKKAAQEIAQRLKRTPPEKIKPKNSFWKKIIDKLNQPVQLPQKRPKPEPISQETQAREHILATEILSQEDMERELGLGNRVKSHQAIKPKLNLGPASENNPEDPFDKAE